MPLLCELKNRGPYVSLSEDVRFICKTAEKFFRCISTVYEKKIKMTLMTKIFRHVGIAFDNDIMNNHILSQGILDNHRTQLCKYIISLYLNAKLYDKGKQISEKKEYVLAKFTKLIQFKNQ